MLVSGNPEERERRAQYWSRRWFAPKAEYWRTKPYEKGEVLIPLNPPTTHAGEKRKVCNL